MAARVFPMKRLDRRTRGGRTPRGVFTANIEAGEDGWYVAYCREIPGCITQGRTVEEATANFVEALEGCLEVLAELAAKDAPKRRSRKRPLHVRRFGLSPV